MAAGLALSLAACAPATQVTTTAIEDPYEVQNRKVHEFNKGVDRAILRPLAGGAGEGSPLGLIAGGVRNLGETLDTPRRIVNNMLQGRPEDALHNGFRLAMNLTFGIGGLLDPATDMGIAERDTDFGETLHVWGTEEGPFLSVPLLGPSTVRDTVGDAVDVALNPLRWTLEPEPFHWSRGIQIAGKAAGRARFGGTVDDVLYDSADSYAQLRLIWLQNRRFELARNARRAAGSTARPTDDGFVDPYAAGASTPITNPGFVDPYADAAADPYSADDAVFIDPYEDTHAQ